MYNAVKRKIPEVDCSIRVALLVLMYPTKGHPGRLRHMMRLLRYNSVNWKIPEFDCGIEIVILDMMCQIWKPPTTSAAFRMFSKIECSK